MDSTYASALSGTLQSPSSGPKQSIVVDNHLPIPVTVTAINADGQTAGGHEEIVKPGRKSDDIKAFVGQYWLVRDLYTGSFVGVVTVTSGQSKYRLDGTTLIAENDLGNPPQSSGTTIIPPDSPAVVVGVGATTKGVIITREQFYAKESDSYSLPANQSMTTEVTTYSGIDQSSSTLSTVSASLSTSASGGWAVISASISATISASSSTQQSVVISDYQTTQTKQTFTNPLNQPIAVFYWNLTDRYTFWDAEDNPKKAKAKASITVTQDPPIISDPTVTVVSG